LPATVRPSTFASYRSLVRTHLIPRLGKIALAKVTPANLSTAYAAMIAEGRAPRTVRHAHNVLGRALREAEIAGLVGRNVCRLTRLPRVANGEMHSLTATQARTFLIAAASDRLGALYTLAIASGARQGELFGLRWQDLDLEHGTMRITRALSRGVSGWAFTDPKTASSRRTVPIGKPATEALRSHKRRQAEERLRNGEVWQDFGLVFTTEIGTPLSPQNLLRRSYYPLLARAGLPRVRFHDLRHTAATLLLEAGAHPRVVAERLGHADPGLTLRVYAHATATMQGEATAAMDRVLGA
jgi:integrase